jgi:hypothetical protein
VALEAELVLQRQMIASTRRLVEAMVSPPAARQWQAGLYESRQR